MATPQNPAIFLGIHGKSKGTVLKDEMTQDWEGFRTKFVNEDIAPRIWEFISFFKNKDYIDNYPVFPR